MLPWRRPRHALPCPRLALWAGGGLLIAASFAAAQAPPKTSLLEEYLAAGEFGPARELAEQAGGTEMRDEFLGQVAVAQATAGARRASLDTAAKIEGDLARTETLRSLSDVPLGAGGGAAEADFDDLEELITSTIEPESWDTLGGPGAISGFEGGVFVDAGGLMQRVEPAPAGPRLAAFRTGAAHDGGNRQLRTSSPLRMISLPRLERALELRRAAGLPPEEAMQVLAGLSKIQYVFVYPESGDVVVAGPAGDWRTDHEGRLVSVESGRPVVRLDDLIVVLRNAAGDRPVFGCSITPYQENLAATRTFLAESSQRALRPRDRGPWLTSLRECLGRQAIDVYGIDPRSRTARVLVEADYHMKLIGMGLEEGTAGVPSYLDMAAQAGGPTEMSVLRWWFTLNYDGLAATPRRDGFEIRGCGVRVLSENELLTERGERVHTGGSDLPTSEFAHNFTRHFTALAEQYPVYAELKNIFDLALVAALLRAEDMPGQVDWHQAYFSDEAGCPIALGTAPAEVESIIAHRVIDRTRIVAGVSGGVRVDPAAYVRAEAIRTGDSKLLEAAQTESRPDESLSRDVWWWDS